MQIILFRTNFSISPKSLNMKKFLLGLTLILTIISCKKEDVQSANGKKDYTSFLAKNTQTFYGVLDDFQFAWSFGWNESQSSAGFENGYGVCDPKEPVRLVNFGLLWEKDLKTRFTIYSPRYNSTSENEIARVFGIGKKKLGDIRNDFYISIYIGGKDYESNNLSPNNEIEILKTEEFNDGVNGKLRVWFRIDAKLSSCKCKDDKLVPLSGMMVAEFYGFRKIS